MTFRPWLTLASLLILLAIIYLGKRASLEGKFLLGAAIASLAAYFHLHFYLLLLTALSFFVFLGVALVWTWIAIRSLEFKRQVKEEAMAGENVPVNYTIRSRASLPLYHARIWDRAYRPRSDDSQDEIPFEEPGYVGFLKIDKREKSEGILHIMPPVRGRMHFGPIAIEGGDPFGIFHSIKWLPAASECLVLPSWVRMTGLPSIPARLGAREQEHLVGKEGHSHEFLGIRPWTDGDSLRGVHWGLTAKHNALIVRQFQKEVEEELLIILDADREGDVGDGSENSLEYLITLSLSLVNASVEMARPWSLVIVDKKLNTYTYKMKEALRQAQYALAGLHAKREEPIEDLLDGVRAEYPNAACILLTPRTDQAVADAITKGDATIGGGIQSILVRVDPNSFTSSVESGLKSIKQRRVRSEKQPAMVSGIRSRLPEITVRQGDNLSDLFAGVVIS
jgi:uncharacterized protein (DUF58 family)